MRAIGNSLAAVVLALVAVAMAAPILIGLSHALVPVIVIGAVAVIAVRLVFFHTLLVDSSGWTGWTMTEGLERDGHPAH
jgi:heme/copper-type cytochrome/quinol oxidase subunit 4